MNKCVTVIVGTKCGDDGKNKLVLREAQNANLVISATNDTSSGHTIIIHGKELKLRLVPVGIVYPHTTCIIGPGTVIDPEELLNEIHLLENSNIPNVRSRIKISGRALVLFDYHKALDSLHQKLKLKPIDTTGIGIGPCYSDKANTIGINMYDLFLPIKELETKIKNALSLHNQTFLENSMTLFDSTELVCACKQYLADFKEMITDVTPIIFKSIINNQKIVVEGTDLEHSNYSSCVSSTICHANIPLRTIKNVILADKSYNTCARNWPFPTEASYSPDIKNPLEGDIIGMIEHEYGMTSTIPKRYGWIDTVILRTELYQSGADVLCLTHLDTLGKIGNELGYIKVCTTYRVNCKNSYTIGLYPDNFNMLKTIVPVYEVIQGGWDIDSSYRDYESLPKKAKEFIELVEKAVGIPVKYIGVGPDNDDLIVRHIPGETVPSRHFRGERK